MASVEPTELTDIRVIRQDGVKNPASGFPILIMKAVNSVGGIDEKPDIAGANRVLMELAKLIQAEAAEMAVGADELCDLQTLVEAACLMSCFRDNEMWGDTDDGSELAKSADGRLVFKAHRKFSSSERKSLAEQGKALPDGSYPIPDVDALHRAAVLAESGHGDVAAAKRLIAKRAKELGVPNPLTEHSDTKKDEQEPEAPESTETETSGAESPDGDGVEKDAIAKAIEAEVAEAMKPAKELIQKLADELAVLKATPIPGGPMLTSTKVQREDRARSDALAKAAYHDRLADQTSGDLAKYHREKAREAREASKA